jgi:hypothetical protein
LVSWMRFQRMNEHWQDHEDDLEKVPVLLKKEYLFAVDAFLRKAYSQLMEWYPTRLLKDLWLATGSFITLSLLWYIFFPISWNFLNIHIKMPLCSPFPGYLSVLVMDNARIHHGAQILELADRFRWLFIHILFIYNGWSPFAEIRIEFLPPYSPDLNPIEEAFSKVKAFIRRHRSILTKEGDGMLFDLMQIMEVVTSDDAIGYFLHGGYF